jgi:hypothetical protein
MPKSSTFTALRHEHVLGLDVAMHDAPRMRCTQHIQQLIGDVEHLGDWQAATGLLGQRSDGLAREQFHHQVCRSVGIDAVVVDLHHARVADGVGNVRLAQQALALALGEREPGMQQLERDELAVAMAGLVHGRHAADSQQPQELELGVDQLANPLLRPCA